MCVGQQRPGQGLHLLPNFNLLPYNSINSFQNVLMKTRSLSVIMLFKNPCNFTTMFTLLAVYGFLIGMKWLYLQIVSTITMNTSWLSLTGNPSIKSMDKSSHIMLGMGNECRSPVGGHVSYFTFCHTSHLATTLFISLFKPS